MYVYICIILLYHSATICQVHFHLSNGADFVSLHWRALESPDALAESFGLLATFQYQEVPPFRNLREKWWENKLD